MARGCGRSSSSQRRRGRRPEGFAAPRSTAPSELNRLDVRTRAPLSEAATAEICRRVEQVFRTSDGLIVLDQLVEEICGVVNATVRETLVRLSREEPAKLIFVDSRRFLSRFDVGVLKGNRSEVSGIGDNVADTDVARSLSSISAKTGRPAYCTVGEQGIRARGFFRTM